MSTVGMTVNGESHSAEVEPRQLLVYFLRENQGRFPGVSVDRVYVRSYPQGTLAAHLFGYVREVNADQLKQAEAILMKDMPWIPIMYYGKSNLISPKIKGFVQNTRGVYPTRFLSKTQ